MIYVRVTARQLLMDIMNTWRNDYLTVAVFAEHQGLSTEHAELLISLARSVEASPHPES